MTTNNPGHPTRRTIYVAPDGTRIQGAPAQGAGSFQAAPGYGAPRPAQQAYGQPATQPYGAPHAPLPAHADTADPQISVGLLAWGVVLMIFGLLLILAPLFGAGSLQTLIVITFAVAGIAFLVLAYMTSRDAPQKKATPGA